MDEPLPDPIKAIMRLNRIDPREAVFHHLKIDMASLTKGMHAFIKPTGNELFFRVRKNPGNRIANLSEIGVPPADKTIGYQRCNGPNEPMLYTGSRRITALLETRVQPGDIVYLCQLIGDEEGVRVNISVDLKAKLPDNFVWTQHSQIILSYFDTLFTRRIHQTYSDDYRFTAAATHALTCGFEVKDKMGSVSTQRIGLRYASVVDVARSYNVAFYPEHVAKLMPMHVAELRIDEVHERDVSATLLDTAIRFGSSGEIMWTGDLTLVPSLRREDRAVTYRSAGNGQWDVDTVDRLLSKEEFHQFLNE